MKIECATSTNNPAFRIYRVAEAPAGFSFVRDTDSQEQLIIFDGDEANAKTLHHETELSLQKLGDAGRRLARNLFHLRLRGIYIAIDQIQLLTYEGPGWNDALHRGVADALREALPEGFDIVEINWRAMMSPPDSTRAATT